MTAGRGQRGSEHDEHAPPPERAAGARRAVWSPAISAVIPTTACAGPERDRRVPERGLHAAVLTNSQPCLVFTFGGV